MSEWQVKPLAELADIRISNVDKKSVLGELPVRLCNYMDVYTGRYLVNGDRYMEATCTTRELAAFGLRRGDVLITKDSESPDDIAIPALIDDDVQELVCGYHLAVLRLKSDEIDPTVLLKQLESERLRRYFGQRAGGSTRYGLSTRAISQAPILVPPEEIQRRIGEIHRSLDTQITHTEALIAKQEQARAGLMQDLFTRGADETGRLRPPREEAPELYHETALGWLPKGWEVTALENLLAPVTPPMRSGPFGSALRAHELVEAGVPLLGIDNIYVEHFEASFSRFVSPAKASELLRYRAFPGDVVITIMGTVGRACVIPEGYGQLLSSKHLWTMTFDTARAVPRLIAWQLNFATWVNAWFRKETQGGIMDAIQSSTLRTLRLPVPPPLEQNLIAERYDAATNLLSQLRAELEKLGRMRTALLRDLLAPTYTAAEPRIAAE